MKIVLDFDGTVYGPSIALKHAVVPILDDMLVRYCSLPEESLLACRSRLAARYGTTSRFMQLQFELSMPADELLRQTYIVGLNQVGPMVLRPGIVDFFNAFPETEILTNAPVVWVEYLSAELGIRQFISKVHGLHRDFLFEKPAPEAFAVISDNHVVMIDDVSDNCMQASKLGWHSFWFPEDESLTPGDSSLVVKVESAAEVLDHIHGGLKWI